MVNKNSQELLNLPNLIISSGKFAYLFIDGNFKKIIDYEEFEDDGFYGITWDHSNVYVGAKDYFYRLDKNFKIKKKFDYISTHGIHQIIWYDGNLYVANTGHNFVDVINTTEDLLLAKYPCTGNRKNVDMEHLNSIFCKNNLFYVASHNNNEPSFITIYDKNFRIKKRYAKVGTQIHNVYVDENDIIYTLNSRSDQVTVIHNNNLSALNIHITTGEKCSKFLRGLAKTKDYFIVGVTTFEQVRKERDRNPSWIFFYDNKWNYVTHIELPECTQISDIRAIGEPDFAHNGVEFPYDKLYS